MCRRAGNNYAYPVSPNGFMMMMMLSDSDNDNVHPTASQIMRATCDRLSVAIGRICTACDSTYKGIGRSLAHSLKIIILDPVELISVNRLYTPFPP